MGTARARVRELSAIATASIITTGIYFGIVILLIPAIGNEALPGPVRLLVLTTLLVAPAGIGALWLSKRLRPSYPRRAARAVATAFAISVPLSLGVAFPVSALAGAYAEGLTGYPFLGLAGAAASVALLAALLSYLPCSIALWVSSRGGGGNPGDAALKRGSR